jgi:hypothetical protein
MPQEFQVACRHGDDPVALADWPDLLQRHHVVVVTAQVLLNCLVAGSASFDKISLLVSVHLGWGVLHKPALWSQPASTYM